MNPNPAHVTAVKADCLARLSALLGDPSRSTHTMRHVLADALSTINACMGADDPDVTMTAGEVWMNVARELAALRMDEEAHVAADVAGHLVLWATTRMGDIGEDEEEWEVLPETVPEREPVGVPA